MELKQNFKNFSFNSVMIRKVGTWHKMGTVHLRKVCILYLKKIFHAVN